MKSHYNLFPVNPEGLEDIAEQLLKGPIILGQGAITHSVLSEDGFYKFPMDQVRKTLSPEYLKFLEESGYAQNLNSAQGLMIAKGVLKIDSDVRQAAQKLNIAINGNDGDYVININQIHGRQLVQGLGYKVPTAAIMYRLFIPYIKELAVQNNSEAQETLNEMIKKAEWLEDLVLNKNKVRIGARERKLAFPTGNGVYFERGDINEFGYPDSVRTQVGEFRYWGSTNATENAVFRGGGAELNLVLNWSPSDVVVGLGVRCANFFP